MLIRRRVEIDPRHNDARDTAVTAASDTRARPDHAILGHDDDAVADVVPVAIGVLYAGRVDQLRSIANPRGNITVEMWFAPSLQYLPVRIRVNMGEGTYLELTVVKIEQR